MACLLSAGFGREEYDMIMTSEKVNFGWVS